MVLTVSIFVTQKTENSPYLHVMYEVQYLLARPENLVLPLKLGIVGGLPAETLRLYRPHTLVQIHLLNVFNHVLCLVCECQSFSPGQSAH